MSFFEYLNDEAQHLWDLTLDHIVLVVMSMAIATVVGVTLGVLTYRIARLRELALAVTGVFLTIPSLALFTLFVAWGVGGITNPTLPVVIALVMYALLPIVRNTIVGLNEVDSAVVESAQGMGMGMLKRLWRIELPLAWPVILTGMRVSTLVVLGIAAIGAYINGPGLGNEIFGGLNRLGTDFALNMVLGGMLGVLILAIAFDLVYVLINRLTTSRGLR